MFSCAAKVRREAPDAGLRKPVQHRLHSTTAWAEGLWRRSVGVRPDEVSMAGAYSEGNPRRVKLLSPTANAQADAGCGSLAIGRSGA